MTLGGKNPRTLVLAALFACSIGAASHADAPGDREDAGRQRLPATAQQAAGGGGIAEAGSPHRFGWPHCRRYFGCLPTSRSGIGFTHD